MSDAGQTGKLRSLEEFELARPREIRRLDAQIEILNRWLRALNRVLAVGAVLLGLIGLSSLGFSGTVSVLFFWGVLFLLPIVSLESRREDLKTRLAELTSEHEALLHRTGTSSFPDAEP